MTSKLQSEMVNFLQAVVSQSVVHPEQAGGAAHQEEEEEPELAASASFSFPLPSRRVCAVLLTEFCGGDGDVVPHVRLTVQSFGQRDLPIINVDVELPLQVRVPVDEVPTEESGPLDTLSLNCWLKSTSMQLDKPFPIDTHKHTRTRIKSLPYEIQQLPEKKGGHHKNK